MNAAPLLLLVRLACAEPSALAPVAAAPLLQGLPTLDTDLERLHHLSDDLSFRMQNARAAELASVQAGAALVSAPTVWRTPRLHKPSFIFYAPVFSEDWVASARALPPEMPNAVSPFFRHNGQLFLVIRRDAPPPGDGLGRLKHWALSLWHRLRYRSTPQTTLLYRIRADGRAVPVLELPTPAGAPSGSDGYRVMQTGPDRFVIATSAQGRVHAVTIDFKAVNR